MSLQKRIEGAFIVAFKEKDMLTKNTLGIVKSKISEWEKANPGKELTDADTITILASEVKKRNQTVEIYKNGMNESITATENLNRELKEIEILKSFLPQQMTQEEMLAEIEKVKTTTPDKLMPAVMKHFNSNFKGKYDNATLQALLK